MMKECYERKREARFLAMLLALLFLFLSLAGCGYREIKPRGEEMRSVGRVGGYTVYYDELFYLTMTYQSAMKMTYGDGAFDTEEGRALHRAELNELVYGAITEKYAVLSLSEEIGYREEDVQELVDEDMEELVSSLGGMHEYKKMLHESYMTDRYARFAFSVSILQKNLLNSYVNYLGLIKSDVADVVSAVMDEDVCARTRHIAVFKDNGKSDAENRALLEDLERQLLSGADFDALLALYGEDGEQGENGYYFMRGEMQKEYEDAAFALDAGQYSTVVETSDAYFIIRREEKDYQYVLLNCYGEGASLYDGYQKYTLLDMIDERREELLFEPNEYGQSLDLTALRQGRFFDLEHTLLVIGYVLLGLTVAGVTVWWIVLSIRADRTEQEKRKKRHSHR